MVSLLSNHKEPQDHTLSGALTGICLMGFFVCLFPVLPTYCLDPQTTWLSTLFTFVSLSLWGTDWCFWNLQLLTTVLFLINWWSRTKELPLVCLSTGCPWDIVSWSAACSLGGSSDYWVIFSSSIPLGSCLFSPHYPTMLRIQISWVNTGHNLAFFPPGL